MMDEIGAREPMNLHSALFIRLCPIHHRGDGEAAKEWGGL